MFTRQPKPDPTELSMAIDDLLSRLRQTDPSSDEYGTMVDQLVKLHALKVSETPAKNRVSPDTWVTISANLLGIAMIVGHERAHIVTSKALGFVRQLR